MSAVKPVDAASLILVDDRGKTPKILMGKRHQDLKFMPSKFVFPGGRLDPSDRKAAAFGALD
ncbi:MAG: NUDIX hydrolase, partial [Alphaproteobacteria bacterium]|nr:NUDIX hydrolase [Alphaproteobacteria bacterium]